MDQIISAIIGGIIFAAFVAGLAESIGAIPFIIIVTVVIGFMSIDVYQLIRDTLKSGNSSQSSK